MLQQITKAEREQELSFEREQRHWLAQENSRQREHEQTLEKLRLEQERELKELDVKVVALNAKSRERYDTMRRIVIALVKLPVLPLAFIVLLICQLRNTDMPEELERFIDL